MTYQIIAPVIPSGQIYQFNTAFDVDYEVRFGRKKENVLHTVVVFGVLNDEYEGEEYSLTNKGDVFKVMNTISEIIRMYMHEHPSMRTYEFTGILGEDEDENQMSQRTKLYTRYLPKVFPENQWETEISGNKIIANRKLEYY